MDGATAGTELDVGENLVLSGLAAGGHTVVAKYGGDGKYGPSESALLTFTIAKAALDINVADVTVNYPNKGIVEVKANVDGKYNITVNDKDYEVTVVDGVGTFDVTEELAVGEYDIEWDIAESENYTAASGSALYKVDKTALISLLMVTRPLTLVKLTQSLLQSMKMQKELSLTPSMVQMSIPMEYPKI